MTSSRIGILKSRLYFLSSRPNCRRTCCTCVQSLCNQIYISSRWQHVRRTDRIPSLRLADERQ